MRRLTSQCADFHAECENNHPTFKFLLGKRDLAGANHPAMPLWGGLGSLCYKLQMHGWLIAGEVSLDDC